MKLNPITRRAFVGRSVAAGLGAPWVLTQHSKKPRATPKPLEIHIFSKHLQFLDYGDLAGAAAELGFAGVDLTVRPGGHVLPERVETDLPKAVAAIKQQGLLATLMTTS